ncbi:hypothetical protein DPMN_188800 [Dreissena polymorpha]|uniref:Uncharacterized protein n=1 Tax=Dreissena polymorpha TaxID=45954 RepID=A0A9D4DRE6_DREPO|nr:hypothetical protein DPMN_188800 [Dreissena polymorpha]
MKNTNSLLLEVFHECVAQRAVLLFPTPTGKFRPQLLSANAILRPAGFVGVGGVSC